MREEVHQEELEDLVKGVTGRGRRAPGKQVGIKTHLR
jgi:hypothetical protein